MLVLKENELNELVGFIHKHYGINLMNKKILIEGRIGNMIEEKGYASFATYFQDVLSDPTKREVTNLVNKLTTNHTFFMREGSHFEIMKELVLPYITSNSKQRDIRTWSAGCSTGEEPYTLAMIMADYLGSEKEQWNTQILATDISVKALETAEKGLYSTESIKSIPLQWKMNYFKYYNKEMHQIDDHIKNDVIFRVFNLMDQKFPFKKKFHAIFCRNVMIYFDTQTKIDLVNRFYEVTEPGGYLFIGHSETIDKNQTAYKYIKPAVFRKEL